MKSSVTDVRQSLSSTRPSEIQKSIYRHFSFSLYEVYEVNCVESTACRSFSGQWWTVAYNILPKFQINRLQHIQNALARTVVQAPKFKHITPILKSLHWLKVSGRIEYKIISLTKFSIPLSLRIYMTSYLFSLFTVTTHALHLMSLSLNHHHHSKSLIVPSDMLTSSLEPASHITQNSSSKLLIPLSATFI